MPSGNEYRGKVPRRVQIADEESSPPARPMTPGPSNRKRPLSPASPASTHNSSTSQNRSRLNPENTRPNVRASASPAPTSTSAQHVPPTSAGAFPNPVPQHFGAPKPFMFHHQGYAAAPYGQPIMNPFMMTNQPAPAPVPVNPPDELGPPPPPPPPPAIPPVLNPYGVHFQPQVPGTEMGPMTHRYVPRHDPAPVAGPTMYYPGQQMSAYMVSA